jgi:hypothetical protein
MFFALLTKVLEDAATIVGERRFIVTQDGKVEPTLAQGFEKDFKP